jgi:hypothetical protein
MSGPRSGAPAKLGPVFRSLGPEAAAVWGRHALRLSHRLDDTGLFTDSALAELICDYPRSHYDLIRMAPQGTGNLAEWVEGDLGSARPEHVLRAITEGRMWLHLRRTQEVDPRYGDLLDAIFEELRAAIPGFRPWKLNLSVLISSPRAQVYYHAYLPGQSLWQVRGSKRVYLYPNTAPFLPEDQVEGVVLNTTEAEIAYEPWFDHHAEVLELHPGEMLHWPPNCPHRIENHDQLSISVTTEHWTHEVRNLYATRYFNGMVRRKLGIEPGPPATRGLRVYPKAAVALAAKKLGWMRAQRHEKRIEWELGVTAPDFVRPISPWVLE